MTLSVLTSLLLVWIGLGVGLIGADGDPINLAYPAVLGLGAVGALVVRFRAGGMFRVLAAVAVAVAAIGVVAAAAAWGQPFSMPAEVLGLSGGFAALFAGAAWLFHRAADAA